MKTNQTHLYKTEPSKTPAAFWLAFVVASLGGVGANAAPPPIEIPNTPIQTGVRVPANVLLVLDDSGSMAEVTPDNRSIGHFCKDNLSTNPCSSGDISDTVENQANSNNPLYYSPYKTYNTWRLADGTYRSDNADFTQVFNDTTQAVAGTTPTINLQTSATYYYYVNKTFPATRFMRDYYRVGFIKDVPGTIQVCEYTKPLTTWGWNTCSAVASFNWSYTDPDGLAKSITITNAGERKNFAKWYSYNRSRSKTAKAGAGFAFADLGENIRVAFDTIHNRNKVSPYPLTSGVGPSFPINVTNENGLFKGTNRSGWYNALYAATASGNTPLRAATLRAGTYFSSKDVKGPYGSWVSDFNSTLRTAPNQISCRQNFNILTTDGYWNETALTQAAEFNDETAGLPIYKGTTSSGPDFYQYQPVLPYAKSPNTTGSGDSLADFAMRYWKTDLRDDLSNLVPATISNVAYWQHMVTFALSIGLRGQLNPETDLAAVTAGTKVFPPSAGNPLQNLTIGTIDDLWHATLNSRGKFEVAFDHDDFARALRSALAEITRRTGSGSNVSANSVSVSATTLVYQASYIAGDFTGDVTAYPIVGGKVDTAAPAWNASAKMPAWDARKIFTIESGTGTTFPSTSQAATIGSTAVIEYLKGNQKYAIDGTGDPLTDYIYRKRVNNNVLGDIVNSSPSYLKDNNTVYIGANDGMMHAFDGTTGVERFAFVPNGIDFNKMKLLSDSKNYIHEFFVDGPVVVSSKKQTSGKNYLVGTLGRGGKGLYGLNVTNSAAFTAADVLWEINSDADGYMGYMISRPIITKVRYAGVTKNVIVASNGINSTADRPALFVIDIATGTILDTLAPGLSDATVKGANGLSAPTGVDSNADGYIDDVYAGDLKGNVWKFNLSADFVTKGDWKIQNGDKPLFKAVDSLGNPQPISGGINIGFNYLNDTWIFFGTGRLMTSSDLTSKAVQSWYGFIDKGTTVTRANFVQRKIIAVETDGGKVVKRAFSTRTATDMAGKQGWYIDFTYDAALGITPTNQGERIVGIPLIRGTLLQVSSIIPSDLECDTGGNGFINVVDAFTGSAGYDGDADGYLDANYNGTFSDDKIGTKNVGSVDLGVNMPTDGLIQTNGASDLLIVSGSTGGIGSIPVKATRVQGRVSWREITSD